MQGRKAVFEMGREILFRGKRKSDGEWILGNLLRTDDDGTCIIQNHVPHHLLKNYEVDPKTVCQYTGLTDKNGRKIFEGDIVSCSHNKIKKEEDSTVFMPEYEEYTRNYAVEFVNKGGHCGYRCRNKSIHFTLTSNTIYNHNVCVIGNLWDNPELLNQ